VVAPGCLLSRVDVLKHLRTRTSLIIVTAPLNLVPDVHAGARPAIVFVGGWANWL